MLVRSFLVLSVSVGFFAAVDHASGSDALSLNPGIDPGGINAAIWWLADSEGRLNLEEVRARTQEFVRNEGDIFNPGVSDAVLWVRVDLANIGDRDGDWIVSLNRFSLETCEIYFVSDGRSDLLLENTSESFQNSYRRFRTLATHIHLAGGESGQVFIRYRGGNWSGLQLTMHTQDDFEASRLTELVVFLVLLGAIGTLVLYGTVSFAFMGAQIVLLYATAQIALFVFYAHMSGFTTVYLWPANPQAGRVVAPVALMAFVIAMAQFARKFFETDRLLPVVDRLLSISVIVGLFAILISPLDYLVPEFDRRIPLLVIYAVSILTWVVMPSLAIHATRRWHSDYWPLAVAWTSMATFMIALQLVWLGVISTVPLGKHSYGAVVFTEAFFVALAIALRIRTLRIEALATQRHLGESLQAELVESQRATQFAEEREWALQDLAEKGRLLLAAGHDTRQMLSALRNYATGLRMGVEGAEIEQVSRDIEQIAASLNEVLTSAVEGARSGGITDHALALDTLTVSSILGPLELIHGHSAREAGLEFRVRRSERPVVTDRVLVLRILGNLLTNAIKYTAAGRILIACRSSASGHRFQVWDTGMGIEEESLRRLLQPDAGALRLQDEVDGVGVGIGIAHKLAERIGGCIRGRSIPGRGSVFELFLPRAGVDRVSARTTETVVVLFDPNREQASQIQRIGESLGIRVESAETAEEIERLLEANFGRPRLILLDQSFGGMNVELEAVKVVASACGVPVAVMTYDRSAEARAKLARDSDLILYRPVSAMALETALLHLRANVKGW